MSREIEKAVARAASHIKGESNMRAIRLEKMSLKDLMDLEKKIKSAISVTKERERSKVRARIEELAARSGFSMDELFNARRHGARNKLVVPKYMNPENASETWSGRGRKPKWLVSKLKRGAKIEQFAL